MKHSSLISLPVLLLLAMPLSGAVTAKGYASIDGTKYIVKDAVIEMSVEESNAIKIHFSTIKFLPEDLAEFKRSGFSTGRMIFAATPRVKAVTDQPIFQFYVSFEGDKMQFERDDLGNASIWLSQKGHISHPMQKNAAKEAVSVAKLQWGKMAGTFQLNTKSKATVNGKKIEWNLSVKGEVLIQDYIQDIVKGGESGTILLATGEKVPFSKARYFYCRSDQKGTHVGGLIPLGNGSNEPHLSFRTLKAFTVDSFEKGIGRDLIDVKGTVTTKNGRKMNASYNKFMGLDFWAPHPKSGLPIRMKVDAAKDGKQYIKEILFD